MVDDSLITEELKSQIGIEGKPVVCEVEKGMIRRFVQAIDDSNPLWQDDGFVDKDRYRGIIAPPTFVLTVGFEQLQQPGAQPPGLMPVEGDLHASTELECYQPVRAGDVVTVTPKIVDIRERKSQKMGNMLFLTLEIAYKNQRQEMVAKCRQMFIRYKSESG